MKYRKLVGIATAVANMLKRDATPIRREAAEELLEMVAQVAQPTKAVEITDEQVAAMFSYCGIWVNETTAALAKTAITKLVNDTIEGSYK